MREAPTTASLPRVWVAEAERFISRIRVDRLDPDTLNEVTREA
jgi:hypothetical protein